MGSGFARPDLEPGRKAAGAPSDPVRPEPGAGPLVAETGRAVGGPAGGPAGAPGRQGECTAGCGACCRVLLLQVNPAYWDREDARRWIELHGIQLVRLDGGIYARIPLACEALTPDGLCRLFGMPERPGLCQRFPLGPRDLAGLEPVCTYTFPSTPAPRPSPAGGEHAGQRASSPATGGQRGKEADD